MPFQAKPHHIHGLFFGLTGALTSVVALKLYPLVANTPMYAIEHGLFGLGFTTGFYGLFVLAFPQLFAALFTIVLALVFHLGNELYVDQIGVSEMILDTPQLFMGLIGILLAAQLIFGFSQCCRIHHSEGQGYAR